MLINKYIDHTLLRADARSDEIIDLCAEAVKYNFKSVCVNPTNVSLASKVLKNKDVKICTVIGFPLGANTNIIKVMEAKDAIEKGADELDVVINVAAMKDNKFQYILNELQAIKKIAGVKIVKIIIETSLLTREEIIKACEIAINSGADFVKTSTGFSGEGATLENIKLIRNTVEDKIQIKASGGIKDSKFLVQLINLGVTRIGTSNGIKMYNALIKKHELKTDFDKSEE